ncbi:MAG: peptidoglycan-binding protein [Bifidobacteriaceae bacterium]|jgi:peptidoglycan hydrolase-like protein with peptidoglycan-binding domain|nr:peptidoglycan-binding protein [Bifidobacteriaceae bacterium]
MIPVRRISITAASVVAVSCIAFGGQTLGPNVTKAEAAQSGASCNNQIITTSGQIPSKGSANTQANRNCLLAQGNYGTAVFALQLSIGYCYGLSTGSPPGRPDAIFGGVTKASLKTIQGRIGTGQDGVYGNNTHNKMQFWQRYQNGRHYCYLDPTKVS